MLFALILAGTLTASLYLPSNSHTSALWPTALAAAKEQIDEGKYDEAIAWLESYVEKQPKDDFANYALGYARLLSSR